MKNDDNKSLLNPNVWVNTLPNRNNSTKKYSTTIVLFIIGLIVVSAIKNETKKLQKEIYILQSSINKLKITLHQATLEHEVLTSPENISKLAKENLDNNFKHYKKSQIKNLNKKQNLFSNSIKKKDNNVVIENYESTKKNIIKKIELKKTELKKLEKIYNEPKKIPGEVKSKLSKKIKIAKSELKTLYSDPESAIKNQKAQKWLGLQVVKAFLGIPVVPGK
tara:strand:+ start:331 stop:993 length:663 start_codon:yes stop_codon:yes gene_type:complete